MAFPPRAGRTAKSFISRASSPAWSRTFQRRRSTAISFDAQRVIEAIETLVRLHTAEEEDIYEAVAAA